MVEAYNQFGRPHLNFTGRFAAGGLADLNFEVIGWYGFCGK